MRLQLEMDETQVQALKDLMDETSMKTYRELFNNALALLQWSVTEIKTGRIIASVDEEGRKYKELLLPVLHSSNLSKK